MVSVGSPTCLGLYWWPLLFSHHGYTSVFVYIATCWVLVAITVGIFGPMTKGRTLV
jgi:hypothetical protein